MRSLIVFCAFLILISAANGQEIPQFEFKPVKELPANIPTCSQNDLNVNDCIKQAFQQMMPQFRTGVKELNIPPLDPFVLEKTSYSFRNGIVHGRFALRNIRIHGLSDTIINNVDFQLKNGSVSLDVSYRIPNILIEGTYKADMSLNELKLTPKGYFNVSIVDAKVRSHPEGELYERDGHTYLKLVKFEGEPHVTDVRIYASGLVPDPELNAVILEFINKNWRQIYESMLPEAIHNWQPLLMRTANEFFAALPFDLLLTKN